jgi:hypothetical protein
MGIHAYGRDIHTYGTLYMHAYVAYGSNMPITCPDLHRPCSPI